MIEILQKPLGGKKGFILGIANEHCIAYGWAQAIHALGADLAITYGHDKSKPYVEPLAKELKAPIFLPCDMQKLGQIEAVFESIDQTWGETRFCAPRNRLCTESGSARPPRRLLTRRFSCRHGCLLSFFHTHGEAGGAVDD